MNSIKIIIISIAISFSFLSIAESQDQSLNYSKKYNQVSWNNWRQDYEATVVGIGGWLSLAGLYWLSEGSNTIGSEKSNTHILPDKAPFFVGKIDVKGEIIQFNTNRSDIFINSKQLKSAQLSVKEKTIVTFGDFEFYIIKREIGFAVRLIDKNSNRVSAFKGTKFFPFTNKLVVAAKLIPHKVPQIIKIPTVYGTTRDDKSAGWLEFEIEGSLQRLEAVDYGKDTLMYVMFSDDTSGDSTYGAGRYIEVEWPDKSGNTFIDFNRTYNPACAFTNYATCPLTPRQNRLSVAINAGELDVVK